ncbi:MAG: cytochrome bd ubiquinol oxidase subunit [Actinomycetota bacterium]|nr:cytochrome bd ubiquinol oxidase subunit [Actinomycetota bacterium]
MTLAEVVLAAMWIGVTLYALFGGADFGAGFWDLVAGGAERGRPQRMLIEETIGPVWEANHVWLIFVLVVLWTGFPRAFAPIMSTLYVPLTAAAIGVILRGGSFVFRKSVAGVALERAFGVTFAVSSVLTPFFLGAVAGGVASGRVPATESRGDAITSWWNPTSILGGVLAVTVCAYLAAVFLVCDAHRLGRPDLADAFRRRAIGAGITAGTVAAAGIIVLHHDAPGLFHGLTHRALPLVVVSAAGGAASLVLLARGRGREARVAAGIAVVAIIWGWAAGQYPYLLEGSLTIAAGAGAHTTLVAMAVALAVAGALVFPPLAYLLYFAQQAPE